MVIMVGMSWSNGWDRSVKRASDMDLPDVLDSSFKYLQGQTCLLSLFRQGCGLRLPDRSGTA